MLRRCSGARLSAAESAWLVMVVLAVIVQSTQPNAVPSD